MTDRLTFTISDTGKTVDGDDAITGEYRYCDRVFLDSSKTRTVAVTVERDAAVELIRLLADRFDLHLARHQS